MHSREKVFIGGSRSLSRLSREVLARLDRIIERGFLVMVGDANGIDKAVQGYLASKNYDQVIVFCMAGACRNNLGHWPTHEVDGDAHGRRDASYYGRKDRAMGAEADYGFMLWDGRSPGTLANIEDLLRRGKPVVAYIAPRKSFVRLRESVDLHRCLGRSSSDSPEKPSANLSAQRMRGSPRAKTPVC